LDVVNFVFASVIEVITTPSTLQCDVRARYCILKMRTYNNHTQGGDENQRVTWESDWHIGFQVFEAVYLTLSVVVSYLRGRKVPPLLSSSVSCIAFSGWLATDARSQKSARAGKAEGRHGHGHSAGDFASMELIAEL
jgi:hypothetical protein